MGSIINASEARVDLERQGNRTRRRQGPFILALLATPAGGPASQQPLAQVHLESEHKRAFVRPLPVLSASQTGPMDGTEQARHGQVISWRVVDQRRVDGEMSVFAGQVLTRLEQFSG